MEIPTLVKAVLAILVTVSDGGFVSAALSMHDVADADSTDLSISPEYFAINDSLEVAVRLDYLPAAAGVIGLVGTVVVVEVPAGGRLSRLPTPPEGWSITHYNLTAPRQRVEFTAVAPREGASQTFPMPLAFLHCEGGMASHTWNARASQGVGEEPLELVAVQHCDQRPPQLVQSPGHAEASTGSGALVLPFVVSDSSPVVQSASLRYPNGTVFEQVVTNGTLAIAIPADAVGGWRYHVEARDAAGNVLRAPSEGEFHLNVTDATPPAVTLRLPLSPEAGAAFEVFFDVTDNGVLADAKLLWSVDDGGATAVDVLGLDRAVLPGVPDWRAEMLVRLVAKDAAGNAAEGAATVRFVDTTPPTPALQRPAPNGAGWHGAPIEVVLTATDAGSPRLTVNYSLETVLPDGTRTIVHANSTPPATLALGTTASYHLNWSARDDAGQEAATLQQSLFLDIAPPIVLFENFTDQWSRPPLAITLRPQPGHSGFPPGGLSWSVDGQAQAAASRNFTSEGIYALAWSGVTTAGVAGSGSAVLLLDGTPPAAWLNVTGAEGATGFYSGNATVSFEASDDLSPLTSVSASVAPGPEGVVSTPFTLTSEGVHLVAANASNAAGLTTHLVETIVIDRTAPVIRILVNGSSDAETFNQSATIEATVEDANLLRFACELNGTALDLESGQASAGPGRHIVRCAAADRAGNEAEASREFVVDDAPPIVRAQGDLGFVASIPRAVAVEDDARVVAVEGRFVSGSPGSTFALQQEGATKRWHVPGDVLLEDGAHKLLVRATDAHGLGSAWTEVLAFTLVTRAPDASFALEPAAQTWIAANATIEWTVPESPVPVEMLVRRDGGPASPVASPLVVATEGTTELEFQTRDALGNLGNATRYVIRIDRAAPRLADSLPPAIVTGSVSYEATLYAVADEGAPVRALVWVDGLASPDGRIRLTTEGRHLVAYRAADEAGNLGPNATSTVVLDWTGPTASIAPVSTVHPQGAIAWSATDALSAVTRAEGEILTAQQELWVLNATLEGATFASLPHGDHTVRVRFQDAAGNWGAWATTLLSFRMIEAPASPLNAPPAIGRVAITLEEGVLTALPVDASDPDGDAVTFRYRWERDGAIVEGASGATIAAAPGSTYRAIVTPSDAIANGNPVVSEAFKVPTPNAPPLAALAIGGDLLEGAQITFTSTSTDPDGLVARTAWVFSDGETAEGVTVARTFAAGPAWAELRVKDDAGATAAKRQEFVVLAPTAVEFTHSSADGALHVLPGLAAREVLHVRQLNPAGPLLLLTTPGGPLVWRVGDAVADPVTLVETGLPRALYARQALLLTVTLPGGDEWKLARLGLPGEGRTLLAVSGPDGTIAHSWDAEGGLHVLTRGREITLRYALSPPLLHVEAWEGPDRAWHVTASATGDAPIRSIKISHGEGELVELLGSVASTVVPFSENETRVYIVASAEGGIEAERELVLEARPTAVEPIGVPDQSTAEIPGIVVETPWPATALALAAFAGAGLAMRRRKGDA